MTVSLTSRFLLNQWGSGSDPFTRAQKNSDNSQIESLGAIDIQGSVAGLSNYPPGKQGRYYWCDDTLDVYRDDGTSWRLLWPGPGTVIPNAPGDALSSGVARAWAAADHNHGLPGWATAATALTYGGTGSAGVANTLPRGDHRHALPASVARTDTAQTFTSSVNASDLQVGGKSIGRGWVGAATVYGTQDGLSNGNESTITSYTFTVLNGRRYRVSVKSLFLMSDNGSGSAQLRLRVNNGGPELMNENVIIPAGFLGPTFLSEILFRGAGATNVNPANGDIAQIAAGSVTLYYTQAKQSGGSSAYPLAVKPNVLSVADISA